MFSLLLSSVIRFLGLAYFSMHLPENFLRSRFLHACRVISRRKIFQNLIEHNARNDRLWQFVAQSHLLKLISCNVVTPI